ncbi:MAG: dephospho-CoA kinase [Bacteroidaceae bacterium]|nr:dephospho-CoA kinase [Bacteroidaceae bacterium]MBR1521145.1 dephospho-CoA kinase [Bacteroidaceae bacterium]
MMNAVRTPLNAMQLHILEMLSYCQTEQAVAELKGVLADFYAKKVQEEADRLWDNGTLNADAIERIGKEHWRTPYRSAQ